MNASAMQTYLFINPFSGSYCRDRIALIVERLNAAGIVPTVCTVEEPDGAPSVFQTINSAKERPLVIVAAGDGTVNAVINALETGAATLAVLPMGTSNVLARELGIHDLEDGIDRIIAGNTRSLAVGVLEQAGISRRFVLMAGFGFDGAVVRDVSPGWKRFLKQGAYGLSALANSLQWDRGTLQVRTGDRIITCHSVIVCNASRYGGSFLLAPECSVFTPGLTAVCVQKNSRRTYLRLAMDLFSGRVTESPELLHISDNDFEITGIKPVQLDGDFAGYSPGRLSSIGAFAQIIA